MSDTPNVNGPETLTAIKRRFWPRAGPSLNGLLGYAGSPSGVVELTRIAVVLAEMVERRTSSSRMPSASSIGGQMQDLVAGILRAMGYRTIVSQPGTDRGVDVFASPDGLGLQEPRIFVEVKHRDQTRMGAEHVRAFLGGRKPGDKCLYVSTGSFTKEARYEAERSSVPTTLLGLQDLRKLLVENYEKLDAETRALVPLKRLYWPLT